ncbi:MAG: hypothetical protein GXO16_03660 [Epsilonproteobacteria bacterium]|nr:hypothetical protein [Campylobacterota bacterium]
MAFKDNLQSDLDIFVGVDEFADMVQYVDSAGVEKEIPAIFVEKSDLVLENYAGSETSIPALILKRNDAPTLHNGELFIVDGKPYSVIHVEFKDEFVLKAYLSKDSRPLF